MAKTYILAASTQLSPYMTNGNGLDWGWKQQMVQWKKKPLVFINLARLVSWHNKTLSSSQCFSASPNNKSNGKKSAFASLSPSPASAFLFHFRYFKNPFLFRNWLMLIFKNSAFCFSQVYIRKFWLMMVLFVCRGNIEVGKRTGKYIQEYFFNNI